MFVSSGVIWEQAKAEKKRYKPMPMKELHKVEEAYTLYQKAKEQGKNTTVIKLDKWEVKYALTVGLIISVNLCTCKSTKL